MKPAVTPEQAGKKFLIIKAGTFADRALHIAERFGDQDDVFVSAGGYPKEAVEVVSVFAGERLLKPPLSYSGVLITGSGAMLSTPTEWMDHTATWLRRGVESDVPILGVCFGHQILAYAMGGTIEQNPNGLEAGTVTVAFNEERAADPLFADFPAEADFHVHHYESVARPPEGATVLARNDHDAHHAVRYARNAWGVQFHPELDTNIMHALMDVLADGMRSNGIAVEPILQSIRSAPLGPELLKRFYGIAVSGNQP